MFRVTIDGDVRIWYTLEHALTDLFSRGWAHESWTLEKFPEEG
jgi:hypothetical protein